MIAPNIFFYHLKNFGVHIQNRNCYSKFFDPTKLGSVCGVSKFSVITYTNNVVGWVVNFLKLKKEMKRTGHFNSNNSIVLPERAVYDSCFKVCFIPNLSGKCIWICFVSNLSKYLNFHLNSNQNIQIYMNNKTEFLDVFIIFSKIKKFAQTLLH